MLSASKQSSAALLPPPEVIHNLCAWLDRLPLSRPKRHLARDFSDGVLVAEIVKHFHPRLVNLHSYVPACSTDQKLSNWSLLNRKVFQKLHLCISEADIQKVVSNKPGVIESILCSLKEKMEAGTAHGGPAGAAEPGLSSVDAVRPLGGLSTHSHTTRIQNLNVDNSSSSEPLWNSYGERRYIPEGWTHDSHELTNLQKRAGLQSPPTPVSTKTLQNQRDLEKKGCCACRGDPVEGLWDHLAGIQQQLEDKEQAIAILQETVKILQMKVMRLEYLVQLKDQRIWELMRSGPEEHQSWRAPIQSCSDLDPEPSWSLALTRQLQSGTSECRTGVKARALWGRSQIWTDWSLVLPIPQCLVIIIDCTLVSSRGAGMGNVSGSPSRVGGQC